MAGENEEGGTVREALVEAVDQVLPETTPQETQVEVAPPETWEQGDKDNFGKIQDPEVRKWLLGRDENTTKKLGEYETRYKGFDEVFAPHMDRISQAGQQPVDVIKNLLTAQVALETEPEKAFLWLANTYKIDLKKLAGITTEKTETTADPLADLDPALKKYLDEINKKVDGVNTFVQTEEQQRQQQLRDNINRQVTEFRQAKDDKQQPLHPHLSDKRVTDRMALLIKSGEVKIVDGDLKAAYKEAYDQAVYSFPDLRPKLQPQPVTKERLLSAKRAGVGVRGVGASQASPQAAGTLRETLREAAKEGGLI